MADRNTTKDFVYVILAWLLAIAMAYVVFVKIKFLFH